MRETIDFYQMLAGKLGEEIPDLHMVMLLYDMPGWEACRDSAVRFLNARYGDEAEFITERMAKIGDPTVYISQKYGWTMDEGKSSTAVFQVNVDQARFKDERDVVTATKGIMTHEFAHVVSQHKRNGYFFWQSHQEEALADLFNCAVMASEGHPHHVDTVMRYRLHSHFSEGRFGISSTEHSFPAIIDEARPLIETYAGRARGDFSICKLKDEAEKIMWRNKARLDEWRHFAGACIYLQEGRYSAPDILCLAKEAGSPFADMIEAHTAFRAAAKPERRPYINPFIPHKSDPVPKIKFIAGFRGARPARPSWFGHVIMHDHKEIDRALCF